MNYKEITENIGDSRITYKMFNDSTLIQDIIETIKEQKELDEKFKELLGSYRSTNISQEASEALFCLLLNKFSDENRYATFEKKLSGNIKKTDIIDIINKEPIELKTKSSERESPSSFSPNKINTRIFIMDVSEIINNRKVFIGEINVDKLEKYNINSFETFREQQKNRRRPRIIINVKNAEKVKKQEILYENSIRSFDV